MPPIIADTWLCKELALLAMRTACISSKGFHITKSYDIASDGLTVEINGLSFVIPGSIVNAKTETLDDARSHLLNEVLLPTCFPYGL